MNGMCVDREFTGVTEIGRTVAVGLVLVGLTVAAAGGGGSIAFAGVNGPTAEAGASEQSAGSFGAGAIVGSAAATTDGENETVPHRNPNEYTEDGDAVGLEAWLSEELTDRLAESASELERGDHESARELVGEDYQLRHAQYTDLAEASDADDADLFEDASDAQLELIAAAESYEELRAEYEQALEEGEEERARELARELEVEATNATEDGDELRELYDELEQETGEDFSETSERFDDVERALERDQAEIREAQFVETELSVEPDAENVSFAEPLVAEGELVTANGSAVADEAIRLDVGNGTTTAETDDDGAFEFEYRPTSEALSADELSVAYVPENESTYLGSETTVPVSIEQVEPTVTDLDVPAEVAYGEEIPVAGTLAVEDEPVDNVTLEAVLEEEAIGDVNVSNGSFDGSVELPASVSDGERELGVRLPFEAQALAETAATESVTVLETATELSINTTHVDDREVFVEGTVSTDEGEPVENESVQVRVGETVAPVTLDDEGAFNETVSAPAEAGGDVRVLVTYDGEGTSFAAADAEETVSLPGSDGGVVSSLPAWAWLFFGLLAVITAAGGVRRYRSGAAETGGTTGFGSGRSGSGHRLTGPDVTEALLSRAAEERSSGRPEAAVQTCYVATRRELASRIGVDEGLTHWEFYRRWRRDGTDDVDAILFDLTEAYERAAFDAANVSSEEADVALERTRHLLTVEPAAGADDAEPAAGADDVDRETETESI